jgi:hypothetical protein
LVSKNKRRDKNILAHESSKKKEEENYILAQKPIPIFYLPHVPEEGT